MVIASASSVLSSSFIAVYLLQEDVSEFATILVNLIEESFDIRHKATSDEPQPEPQPEQPVARKNRHNPIVNLLNGELLMSRSADSSPDGRVVSSMVEVFREVNVQVNLHLI